MLLGKLRVHLHRLAESREVMVMAIWEPARLPSMMSSWVPAWMCPRVSSRMGSRVSSMRKLTPDLREGPRMSSRRLELILREELPLISHIMGIVHSMVILRHVHRGSLRVMDGLVMKIAGVFRVWELHLGVILPDLSKSLKNRPSLLVERHQFLMEGEVFLL